MAVMFQASSTAKKIIADYGLMEIKGEVNVQRVGIDTGALDHLARCSKYSSLLTSQLSFTAIITEFSMISFPLLLFSSKLTVSRLTFSSSTLPGFSFMVGLSVFFGLISTKFRTFCQRKYLQSGWQTEQKQLDCVGMCVLLYVRFSFWRSMFSKSLGSYYASKECCVGVKVRRLRERWSKRGLLGPVSGYRKAYSYYLVPLQKTSYSNSSSYSIINELMQINIKEINHPLFILYSYIFLSFCREGWGCAFAFNQNLKQYNIGMAEKLSITFDEENNIRVLDPEKFRESDHLKGLSMEFITKVITMDETMSSLTECLDDFAVQIEKEKLRALGERNKWESETENRKRKMMELNNLLNEKKAELERYTVELESLAKVEAEQKALINKLSSNQ